MGRVRSEMNKVVAYALKHGFTKSKTAKGHIILMKDGHRIPVASSPSCPHAAKHAQKEIDAFLKDHP